MLFRYVASAGLFVAFCAAPWSLASAGEGALDPSFGIGGKSSADITGLLLDDAVGDIALLPDGRILVVGTTSSGFPSERNVAAVVFKPDGSVDESFGQRGRVLIDQGGNEYCNAVAVQSDGRIVLGGYRIAFGGESPESLILCLDPSGAIDTTFGVQGAFGPALPLAVVDLSVLSDGAIIAAGTRPSPSGSDFAITRLTSTGTFDVGFGDGGVVILDFGADDYLTQLSVDVNGRLLVVGLNTAGALELSRLSADGSLDLTFHGTGFRVVDLGCSYDASAAIQPDGKIVVGTTVGQGELSNFLLVRFNPDGTLDAGFGAGGTVTGDLTGTDDYLTCVTLQPDGKILAVGWAGFYPDFLIQRYNPNGSVDEAFGPGGWVHTDFIGDKDRARVAVVQPDGRFVLAGDIPGSNSDESRDFGLARYELITAEQSDRRVTRSLRIRLRPRIESVHR